MTKQLLMANEAFAHAALEAGVGLVAGYPGTPSSEVVETVAKLVAAGRAHDVHVEWSTNEKAALEVCAGASLAGKRALFTCKQVGLNVASDALLSLVYIGVKGGLVLYVADDPGPISSQTEQDTRRFAPFAKLPLLDPSTPDEGAAMIRAAFDLSEKYGCPVIVRSSTRVSHASTFFDVADETWARPAVDGGWEEGKSWVTLPAKSYWSHARVLGDLDKIANDYCTDPTLAAFNVQFEGGATGEGAASTAGVAPAASAADAAGAAPAAPRLGIVCGGVSTAYAREALRLLEADAAAAGVPVPAYRFLQVATPYPWPAATVDAFAEGLDEVYVYEELDGVLEDALHACASLNGARIRGRLTGEALIHGENSADDAYTRLAAFLGLADKLPARTFAAYRAPEEDALPTRPPVLCAGCPHRGSFYALKQALGRTPHVFCGDIGCYTLGNAAPLGTIETCLCMGAGITMAQGLAAAEPGRRAIAFVGDSTFFASGLTGLVNAVYNRHNITVVVLDNSTTAMTGAQPHPGTGITLMGERHPGISIEGMLRAIGFACVVTANPLVHAEALSAAKEAVNFDGPSAIVFKSPCIQLIKKGAPLAVDASACTGCKRCINAIGCPGIAFDAKLAGPKSGTRGQACIDPDQCNGCGLCAQICPFGAIGKPEVVSAGQAADSPSQASSAKGGASC